MSEPDTDQIVATALLAELRDVEEAALRQGRESGDWTKELTDVRTPSSEIVNELFRTRLLGHQRIRAMVEELSRG